MFFDESHQQVVPEDAGIGRDELVPFVKEVVYCTSAPPRPVTTYGTAALYLQDYERCLDGGYYRRLDNRFHFRATTEKVRNLVRTLASPSFPQYGPHESWSMVRERLQSYIAMHGVDHYIGTPVWPPSFLKGVIKRCQHKDQNGSVYWLELLYICVCDSFRVPEAVTLLKVALLMFGRRVAFGAVVTILRHMVRQAIQDGYQPENSGHALYVLAMLADMVLFDRLAYPGVHVPIPTVMETSQSNPRFYLECLFYMESPHSAVVDASSK